MNKLFLECAEGMNRTIDLLERGYKLFPSTKVQSGLLNQGLTQYRGIILPLSEVIHKYQLEYYEKTFLNTYISLLKTIQAEKDSKSTEFCFRVLLEMGVEQGFLLFSNQVEDDDKRLYKVISMLVDYSAIQGTNVSFREVFNKLLSENKAYLFSKLSGKNYQIIESLEKIVNEKISKDIFIGSIKNGRKLFENTKSRLIYKYSDKKIYKPHSSYKGMMSGESHTLHGNIFLLYNRLSKQTKNNHLYRLFAYSLFSSTELLANLKLFLNNIAYTKEVEVVEAANNILE
jgi:hypothetical protein